MRISFTVTGGTKKEVEAQAQSVLEGFLKDEEPVSVDSKVRPLVMEFGTEQPAMWEADIEAVA